MKKSSLALITALATPLISGAVQSFATVSESYDRINIVSPDLSKQDKARMAWLNAGREGERFYSVPSALNKRVDVTLSDLNAIGVAPNSDVDRALSSIGLNMLKNSI